MNVYFTSDLHFGHKNIIRYDHRPFSSVQEMDTELILRWNNKVKDEDLVYILGDVSWYNHFKTCELLDQMKGKKCLIQGNHDRFNKDVLSRFIDVRPYAELKMSGNRIILCHYPIMFFNVQHHGAYMFYGHVHNSYEWTLLEQMREKFLKTGKPCNMYNVGTMLWNYEPVSFEEITGVRT